VAQRYRVQHELGRGAVGITFAVFDEREQRQLALKRFSPKGEASSGEELRALFRREYSILAQFAHPTMVRVYDFGLDEGVPFYTMELVTGEHPGARGPMPWRDVCRILVEVCEPLALLHSRGWVHRDVSPRNVYVTATGSVKLIDFGAIAALNAQHRPIGTPPCVAPETLRRQHIDARTDLFALGALGYFALTGRHAYPARVLSQLPLLWQTPPAKPSEFAKDVPEAVDELILSLLCLDMDARPRQVAEVVTRLIAAADLPTQVQSQLAHASLTNTGLIGRESELERMRDLLRWTAGGRSTSCVIRGPRGSGHTRLLDALALEAKLLGHGVMRANASLSGAADFALARELCAAQWANEPSQASATGHTLESALALFETVPGDQLRNVAAQRAFIGWCELWSQERPMLLIVDEGDETDAESAKLLASLARRTEGMRLTLALSLHSDRSAGRAPIQALTREATKIDLEPLDREGVEKLLRALFGDVPNLSRVAQWCQRTTGGQPGACVLAVRSLVDNGTITFESGSWQLPAQLQLPQPSTGARVTLDRGLERLSPVANELLQLLALVTQPAPFAIPRYVRALQQPDALLVTAEGELFARHLLVTNDKGYTLRDTGVLSLVRERMTPPEAELAHTRLAEFYAAASRGICAAYHFWQAGRPNQAEPPLTAALSPLGVVLGEDPETFTQSRAAIALYEAMLARRKQRNAAPSELYPLRMALLTAATVDHVELARYADETIAQLRIDVGFDLWEESAEAGDDAARMRRCLELAYRRYQRTPEAARGLPPELATRAIVGCSALMTGVYPWMCDVAASNRLAALIVPLRSLAPAFELAANLAEQSALSVTCDNDVIPLRQRTLLATRDDVPGIHSRLRLGVHFITTYYLAMDYADLGRDEALKLATKLQAIPMLEGLGLQVRRLHALAYARFEDAQRYRRDRERLSFQNGASDHHLRMSLRRELTAAYACRDLLEVTRYASELRERAALYPGWQPWAALGQAFRHALADEPAAACEVAGEALLTLEPFAHGAYQQLVWVKADAHNDLRDHAQAKQLLLTLLAQADARGLTLQRRRLYEAGLAVAEAGTGAREAALAKLDELLAGAAAESGQDTILYGRLCESRCQAACIVKDYSGFAKHLELMERVYSRHPSLRARHARWVRAGQERFQKLLALLAQADAGATWTTRIARDLPSQSLEHQGDYLLALILDEIAVDAGHLFRVSSGDHLQLMAARPSRPDERLSRAAQQCFAAWSSSDELQTADGGEAEEADLADSQGRTHVPLWLTKPSQSDELTGLVLLACSSSRLAELSPAFVRAISQQLEILATWRSSTP
jgi:tRNA A-37 threonylcarbamoyl transferase component Bud32